MNKKEEKHTIFNMLYPNKDVVYLIILAALIIFIIDTNIEYENRIKKIESELELDEFNIPKLRLDLRDTYYITPLTKEEYCDLLYEHFDFVSSNDAEYCKDG